MQPQFVHNGANHVIFNIVLQIIFGLPLNMVHGSLKFGLIYELGVSHANVFAFDWIRLERGAAQVLFLVAFLFLRRHSELKAWRPYSYA